MMDTKQRPSNNVAGVRRTASCVALAALIAVVGCHSHVRLDSPGPRATEQQRIAAFKRLHSQGRMDAVLMHGDHEVARSTNFVVLANGERVYYPEDLIPVVGEQSPSGRAAAASRSARQKKVAWYTVSAIAFVVSMAAFSRGLDSLDNDDPSEDSSSLLLWGSVIGMVASTAALFPGYYYEREEADTRVAAFMIYDESLRERLRLCIRDQRVVDCGTSDDAASRDDVPMIELPEITTVLSGFGQTGFRAAAARRERAQPAFHGVR